LPGTPKNPWPALGELGERQVFLGFDFGFLGVLGELGERQVFLDFGFLCVLGERQVFLGFGFGFLCVLGELGERQVFLGFDFGFLGVLGELGERQVFLDFGFLCVLGEPWRETGFRNSSGTLVDFAGQTLQNRLRYGGGVQEPLTGQATPRKRRVGAGMRIRRVGKNCSANWTGCSGKMIGFANR